MFTILFSLCIEILSHNRTSRTSWKSCTQKLWVWLRDHTSVQKGENKWGRYPQQPQVSTCVCTQVIVHLCTHMHPDILELACMHIHTHMSMHIAHIHTHKYMNEDVVAWHTWTGLPYIYIVQLEKTFQPINLIVSCIFFWFWHIVLCSTCWYPYVANTLQLSV